MTNALSQNRKWSLVDWIIVLSCAILPIVPYYFILLGNGFSTYLQLIIIAFSFLVYGKIRVYHNKFSKLLIIYYGLTSVIQFCNGSTIDAVLGIIFLCMLLVFVSAVNTEKRFILACDCLIVAAVLCNVFAIVESVTGFNIFELLNVTNMKMNLMDRFGMVRVLSFTGQSINFGISRAFIGSLISYRLSFETKRKTRRILIVAFLLNVVAVMLALSRLGILVFLASQILIMYHQGLWKTVSKIFKYTIIVVILLSLLCAIVPNLAEPVENITKSIVGIFDDNVEFNDDTDKSLDNAYSDRFSLYKWTWSKMKGHKIFGNGEDVTFSHSYKTDNGQYFYTRTKRSLEVQYLVWLFKSGIAGLALNVWFIFSMFFKIYINRRKTRRFENKISFNWVILSIFVPYWIGFFGVNMAAEKPMYMILIGLCIAYNTNLRSRNIDFSAETLEFDEKFF